MLKNPYGLKDGLPVFVADVPSGLACECVCPACGHPLEARKCDFKQDHFTHHRGSDCGAGYQTALHLLAKEILEQEKRVFLPRLRVEVDRSLLKAGTFNMWNDIIPDGKSVRFDEVVLEKKIGGVIPDVLLRQREKRLMVEITVTHGIDAAKLARIEELNISTVEFDFRRYGRIVTPDDLKRELLFDMSRCARWAYHVLARQEIERLNSEYTAKYLTPVPPPPPPKPPQKRLFS